MSRQQLFFEYGSPYEPPPLPLASPSPLPPPSLAPPLDQELAERISRKVARKIARSCTDIQELDMDDLIQIGLMAIFSARSGYKPERGALSTFMWVVALRAMQMKLRTAYNHLSQDRTCYHQQRIRREHAERL